MSNRLKGIIAVILAVILIIVIAVTPLKSFFVGLFGSIISPICGFFENLGGSVSGWFGYMSEAGTVHQKNAELEKKIAELNVKIDELKGFEAENTRLNSLLELKNEYSDVESTGARIIAKESGNWFTVFTINKGTNDGIQKNQPVLANGGLVGHTTEVGSNWAKVVTLIDTTHSVSSISQRSTDYVQIDGDITLMGGGLCKMTAITENADVIVGDILVTSGIGGVYPKGIVVGTVREFKTSESGTGSYAVVKPVVDFQRIAEVLVLKIQVLEE